MIRLDNLLPGGLDVPTLGLGSVRQPLWGKACTGLRGGGTLPLEGWLHGLSRSWWGQLHNLREPASLRATPAHGGHAEVAAYKATAS